MISVDPQLRPTCDEILEEINAVRKNPDFLNEDDNKKEDEFFKEMLKDENKDKTGLIGTIKLPENLNNLDMSLPEPNYIKSYPDGMNGFGNKLPVLNKKNRTDVEIGRSYEENQLPHLRVMNEKIQSRANMSLKREPSYRYNYGAAGDDLQQGKSLDNRREAEPILVVHKRNSRREQKNKTPKVVGRKKGYQRDLPHYKSADNRGQLPQLNVKNQRNYAYRRPDWWG